MATNTLERQTFRIKIQSSGVDPTTWILQRHIIPGGAGPMDQGLEFEGFYIQLHDNADGTYTVCTTTNSDATDVLIEIQGFRLRLHPTGETITKGGVVEPLYAIVVVNV